VPWNPQVSLSENAYLCSWQSASASNENLNGLTRGNSALYYQPPKWQNIKHEGWQISKCKHKTKRLAAAFQALVYSIDRR